MTTTTPPPSGYTFKPKPRSVEEAISQHANERLKSIAKNALHTYIASFLNTEGVNRSLITTASPSGLQFITDRSFDPATDPTKRATQLARFYNEIRQELPAILIVDAGCNWRPASLGSIEKATIVNGVWQGWFTAIAGVPVTVAIVTGDQETTDLLQNILALLFGPLRNIAGGSRIFSPDSGDNWEVRIPLAISMGGNTPTNVTDDAVDQYWAATIEMELDSEATFIIERDINDFEQTFEGGNPIIYAPDTATVNERISLRIGRLQDTHRVILDDPRVATLDLENFVITPRRVGTVTVQVIDLKTHEADPTTAHSAHRVVSEHPITITL